MVGGTERPGADQGNPLGEFPPDGMDLGGFQRLLKIHLRQDGGQAFGQHTFPGPWRPDQQHVVAAAGSDLQGAFRLWLALYIGKVQRFLARRFPVLRHSGDKFQLAAQMVVQLHHIPDAVHVQPLDHSAFPGVFLRNIQPFEPSFFGFVSHGQHAPYRTDFPREGKLPQKDGVVGGAAQLLRCL